MTIEEFIKNHTGNMNSLVKLKNNLSKYRNKSIYYVMINNKEYSFFISELLKIINTTLDFRRKEYEKFLTDIPSDVYECLSVHELNEYFCIYLLNKLQFKDNKKGA